MTNERHSEICGFFGPVRLDKIMCETLNAEK